MSNVKFRNYCKLKGVRLFEVAAAMGVYETTLFRRLRTELGEGETARLIKLVDEIAARHEEEARQEVANGN